MNPETLAAFYIALNLVSALFTFSLAVYFSKRQGLANAFTFVLLLCATAVHSLTNVLMMISPTPEIAGLFENLRWLTLAAIPPFLLTFILDYTGRDKWLAPQWLVIYFAIPLLTQVVVWTNNSHHLMI